MSSKSKQQLKLDNQTNFPNNNNGFITPDKLRNFHVDIIDSFLTQDGLDTLSTELSNEITERISADQSLSTAIAQSGGEALSQEISNRISGDQSLSTSISQEASQRISADKSILNKISSDYVPYSGANKSVDLGLNSIKATGIKFNTTPMDLINNGDTRYNVLNGSLETKLDDVTLQHGQEIIIRGIAVGIIQEGDVVQRVGAQGDFTTVKKANPAEILLNNNLIMGVATTNAQNGQVVWITYFGNITNVKTNGWSTNDELYFDWVTGGLTNEKPIVPNQIIKIGVVSKQSSNPNASNGIIKIKEWFGTKLVDLSDVNGTTPTKGAFPVFQDEGYFDFTHNINDYALQTSLSTEISERISANTSLTNLISSELSTEMSQRVSADASLTTELGLTTAIAKGAQQALGFQNYGVMVDYVNSLEEPIDETTKVGQSIYIRTLEVPDIWISGNIFPSIIPTQYNYISDQKLVDDVNANGGYLQMGFYYISFLETEKVDLSGYALSSDLSTAISTEESIRLSADQSLSSALSTEISNSISANTILSNSISSEISDRISGDLSLSTELSSEISRALSAESSLSTSIENIPVGGEEVEITKEFVLGNNSDAGDLMMLNDNDGKVYSPELYADKTFSTATTQYYTGTIQLGYSFNVRSAISEDGTKVAFYHFDTAYNLILKVGFLNEDLSITFGDSVTIEIPSLLADNNNPAGISFLPTNNNKIIVGYKDQSQYYTIRIITLNGNQITNIGDEYIMTTTGNYGYSEIVFNPYEEDKFIFYIGGGDRFNLNYLKIDSSDNITLLNSFVEITNNSSSSPQTRIVFDPIVKNRFILCGVNGWGNGFIYIFNIIGSTFVYKYADAPNDYVAIKIDFDPFNKNKLIYYFEAGSDIFFRVATINPDLSITYTEQNPFITGLNGSGGESKTYFSKNIKNRLITYVRGSNYENLKLVVSNVSGTTITQESVYDITAAQSQNYLFLSNCKKRPDVFIIPITTQSGANGYVAVTQLPFTNLYNFNYNDTIGFLTETGLEGETKKVRFLGGIDYNKSSLISGQRYYIQEDGSISLVSSEYEYGEAISTTEIKTNSKNEIYLTKDIDSLNGSVVNIMGYVDSSINNILEDIDTKLSVIPTGYEISYLGFAQEYWYEKTNITNLQRVTPVYANMYVVGHENNIYFYTYFPDSSTMIIGGMFLKKIMTYGKYVLIHAINYGDNNNSEFNILGVERNHTFLLDLSTGNVTGIRPSELTFFNYTDKIAYTRDLGGLHHIYDLKTQTEIQLYPPNASSIIYPKSNTHCYMIYGTTIGYYAYSDLSTPIWSQTMPGSYTAANFAYQLDFSAEYDLIFGGYNGTIFVYPILANLIPRQLRSGIGGLQLSKDILSLRHDAVLRLWDVKTLNYIGQIMGYIYPWLVSSNEDGLYTLYDNKAIKIYT